MLTMIAGLTVYCLMVLGLTCLISEVSKHYYRTPPKGGSGKPRT